MRYFLIAAIVSLVISIVLQVLRRSRSGVPRPEWARFFTHAQWQQFLDAVMRNLSARGVPFRYTDGMIDMQVDDSCIQLSLGNLAQTCHQAPQHEWEQIIAWHLDNFQRIRNSSAELPDDFASVKDQLFVRLMPLSALPLENLAVARNDIPGVIAYLALDMPTSVRSIAAGETAPWKKTPGELYDVALNNIRIHSAYEVEKFNVGGTEFIGISGQDFFVASHALLLHEYPDWLGKYGALLIIPTRHALVLYPINDLSFLKAMQVIALLAQEMEKDGPGSITAQVYWYFEGQYLEIPYTFEKKNLSFSPPPELLALANRLAEEEGEAARGH